MRWIAALALLGSLLLGSGFALGAEPVHYAGVTCGGVLRFDDLGARPAPESAEQRACAAHRDGLHSVLTWVALGMGSIALLVAWTAYREQPAGRGRQARTAQPS